MKKLYYAPPKMRIREILLEASFLDSAHGDATGADVTFLTESDFDDYFGS